MYDYYLSLGSNIDPEVNLIRAVEELARYGTLAAASKVWETAPIGFEDQPNFLNAVVLLRSSLPAAAFQEWVIPKIETVLDRIRGANKFGPRTIDIDVLMVNDQVLKLGHRNIPSPEILERAFVAVPMAEIAPRLHHPITGETMYSIAEKFSIVDKDMVVRQDVSLDNQPTD